MRNNWEGKNKQTRATRVMQPETLHTGIAQPSRDNKEKIEITVRGDLGDHLTRGKLKGSVFQRQRTTLLYVYTTSSLFINAYYLMQRTTF